MQAKRHECVPTKTVANSTPRNAWQCSVEIPNALVQGSERHEAAFKGKTDSKDQHVTAGALNFSQGVHEGLPVLLVTHNEHGINVRRIGRLRKPHGSARQEYAQHLRSIEIGFFDLGSHFLVLGKPPPLKRRCLPFIRRAVEQLARRQVTAITHIRARLPAGVQSQVRKMLGVSGPLAPILLDKGPVADSAVGFSNEISNTC